MKTARHTILILVCAIVFLPLLGKAQSLNGTISGTVTDPTGATIPGAVVTLTAVATGVQNSFTTGSDGLYTFPNVTSGVYKIAVSAGGFRGYVQDGITIRIGDFVRVDVKLELGATAQKIEVAANASPLNYDNPEVKSGVAPETILELPLMVAGGPRTVGSFITLVPGVTSSTNEKEAIHINGSLEYEGATVLDGIPIVYTTGGNGMFNLISDFPQSPDMIGEMKVLTSNYEAQYGNAAGAQILLETKGGTDSYHGALFEYNRNTGLNARQFDSPKRTTDIENDFGGAVGGPVRIPGLRSAKSRPFFYFDYERYRAAGALTNSPISIPSIQERAGDFSDWKDTSGNLIPIYDPATTAANPNYNPSLPTGAGNLPYLRSQFMGCNGNQPNVICASDPRLVNSMAYGWLKYLPQPTSSAPLFNYLSPTPPASFYEERNMWDLRLDEYWADKDHVSLTAYRMQYVPTYKSLLPPQLATEVTTPSNYNWMVRLPWDHTISPTMLNHFTFGYTQAGNNTQGMIDLKYVSDLPTISGVPNPHYAASINFSDGFHSYDGGQPSRGWSISSTWNDLFTWVHGKHTLKFGGDYTRNSTNTCGSGNPEGVFNFARGETGVLGLESGSPIASFLLGQVDSGTGTFYGVGGCYYPRQYAVDAHAGDTWKATPKMSVTYGLRWDLRAPSEEKYNHMSFFDPAMANPGAGGLLGALAFPGNSYGSASFGARYPEQLWHRGFAPRIGLAYTVSSKTVVRTGYGIFYSDAKYPGWGNGVATDGFDANPTFSSTEGGMQAAFLLSQGLPQDFAHPPFIDPSYDNGLSGPNYRQFTGNRLPYTQQWDLTVERQFTNNFYVSTAYIGNKGTRLYSASVPLNALNPSLLSMGSALFGQFTAGETILGGVSAPYTGWAQQMSACAPSVAQALVPYPQYCGALYGINENAGSSEYNSFVLKTEKRVAHGAWLQASYTISKLLSTVDSTQPSSEMGGTTASFSPFERSRNKSLSGADVPQTVNIAFMYELPFGSHKRWLGSSHGALGRLVSGWEASGIFMTDSGTPLLFRSSYCNVPSEFDASCIPAILPGANPWAQSKGSFNPNLPLLNAAAFESPSSFNYYLGQGPRVSNLRGFGYHNQDFALIKNTQITERVSFQLRAEFFNLWNWHIFASQGNEFTTNPSAFVTDVASPSFGTWNGSVTAPRNIQIGGRLAF
jgi:hypothetical protein